MSHRDSALLAKYQKGEEDNGFIRTHYFKKVEGKNLDKNLVSLEKMFLPDDIFLDVYINEKERNNFDFYLNNLIDEKRRTTDFLTRWTNIEISNIYNYILYNNASCSNVMDDKKGHLVLKLKYTNENKTITSYFKVHCRNVKWDSENKVWHIPIFYIYEMTKLTIFLGGTVSDTVLYYVCKLFSHFASAREVGGQPTNRSTEQTINRSNDQPINRSNEHPINESISQTNVGETGREGPATPSSNQPTNLANPPNHYDVSLFSRKDKRGFVEHVAKSTMFAMQHIILHNPVRSDSVQVKIIPYNEEVVRKMKELNLFHWDKTENIWTVKKTNFKTFHTSVIKGLDYKLCSYYDCYKFAKQQLLVEGGSSLGNTSIVTLATSKKGENKISSLKRKRKLPDIQMKKTKQNCNLNICYESTDSSYSDELSHNVDASYYEGREQVNKIKLIGAANNYYRDIIYNKLNKLKHLKPPNFTYDPKGLITKNGAGTKGIEIYDMPSDINEWNKISFCIVPDEKEHVDLYDPKILCSLVSDVYMLKEKAIDIILKKFQRWPEYTDVYWNNICTENEFIVRNKNFNTRQKLAHDRLFSKQFFYIFNIGSVKQSNYYDALFLCKALITLGEGKIVKDPLDAEYIVVANCNDPNAVDFYNSLQGKQKKKKLPLFVTPTFIYDCILNYSVSYPSKNKSHFSFT
ncbi:conserved Plasmodium protein, unknown function [Plasmodium knowlesi strain H]|uniref:Uncharacterized protein n=3 Tax=Plasmodium knowlesi TaxID=5850 RepID=A0A5K1UJK5_PLAKH|nr:conserved protein, unknown function [Plasmodium knowlesi strain H]OTN66166.1 Uncharacterized protein PKNOH_S09516800 [Plasmodium knowlesi]CAA9986341.1 conserved protein, unknown function [Plasmodium knowlesi strain H]SBO25588.1 conserved Plasmodium protein, unknown function [Plasmodium knowlesi strain H]SBO28325.1 conserved Plasmodium protein, unknown function [Plasmodium knowlesi strain H]VVS75815.1 conserved protein, unknown function [Plasmodium knowlesi strain H]|eukprot:XP_002257746.1 hypothetical protein, conserved in Plasmodium species [Plasmodium knowlesi strain H]